MIVSQAIKQDTLRMSALKEKLPVMMNLAYDRSEESRIRLADMLADVFLNSELVLSLREEELANELIDQLLLNSTPAVQDSLISKFNDVSRLPPRIAASMARAPINVAKPILIGNMNFTDAELVDFISTTGTDHAIAIAARSAVSEAVADALVTTGDVRVMQAVAENLGARLTPHAINVIADAARFAIPLREPVLHRPEMNSDTALKLYWLVDQDLRRYVLKRFNVSAGQVDQALAATIRSFLDDHTHEKENDQVMGQVADWLETHQAVKPQILPQVLRMGHFRLFNILLARLTNLSLSLVDAIMSEAGGRGLASICRAIDIDKAGFVSLFLLSRGGRPGNQIVNPRELSRAVAIFDRVTPAMAKDLLHSWNANPDYFTKHVEDAALEEQP